MRLLLSVLGWFFLILAAGCLWLEAVAWRASGTISFRQGGAIWYDLDPGSLNLVQAVIERHLWSPLWDPGMLALLQLPALPFFALMGIVFLILAQIVKYARRTR